MSKNSLLSNFKNSRISNDEKQKEPKKKLNTVLTEENYQYLSMKQLYMKERYVYIADILNELVEKDRAENPELEAIMQQTLRGAGNK